jgi:hypothetical protein
MLPKLNRKRALFVLTKIDEILAWERRSEAERDTRFVELGRYLCEVRAGQYWRLEKLKSFDEFLARRFPESWRKAYYLSRNLVAAISRSLRNNQLKAKLLCPLGQRADLLLAIPRFIVFSPFINVLLPMFDEPVE